jgi:hypothetical protein
MNSQQPLIETNPYLKDPTTRAKVIARSVETSCRVEGINIKLEVAKAIASKFNIPRRGNKRIYQGTK